MQISNEKVNEKIEAVITDVNTINTIYEQTVFEYTKTLDELMQEIHSNILEIDTVPINTLENYFIKLSSEVYFISANVEKLGLFDSLSKARAQDVYNNKYLEYQFNDDGNGKKPTVASISAKAELDSLFDNTVNDMYNKAYKTVKNKISAAETMISTLSKILSHRMQESQLTTQQTERQILNESKIF